jgi:Pentapeptide repeats (8 copies)
MPVLRWAAVGALVGAAFAVVGLSLADLLDQRLSWLAVLTVGAGSGATAALAASAPTVGLGRPAGTTLLGILVLLALVAGGLALWFPGGDDPGTMDTDLGTALLGGAVVACAVLFLQRRLDAEWRGLDEARAAEWRTLDAARAEEDERRRLRDEAQLLCAMVHNLTGVDFRGRDLSGLVLRNKMLVEANLNDADLRRAVLTRTNFTGAELRGAKLGGAQAKGANFRGATLVRAKFGDAVLDDADLRGCDLHDAELDGARLEGAKYGKAGADETHWPDGFDVDASGAVAC